MQILGIDPGSRATGYALLEVTPGGTTLREAGVLRVRTDGTLAERLGRLTDALEEIVHRVRPDVGAVEDLFHAVNARSALRLAHARGAILAVFGRHGVPVAEYTPLQVKKAVSGYGLATKDDLRTLIERLLAVPPGRLARDASDAAAVALCHAQATPMALAIAAAGRSRENA